MQLSTSQTSEPRLQGCRLHSIIFGSVTISEASLLKNICKLVTFDPYTLTGGMHLKRNIITPKLTAQKSIQKQSE